MEMRGVSWGHYKQECKDDFNVHGSDHIRSLAQ